MAIHLRSRDELEKMHRAGLIVHEVLTVLRDAVRPGLTTMDLEKLAEEKIAEKPGKPAFKGYRRPSASCAKATSSRLISGWKWTDISRIRRSLCRWERFGRNRGSCWM